LTKADPPPKFVGVTRRVICISRTLGGGGEEVGRLVADRLGFTYVDEEIVARAALRGGVGKGKIAEAEQPKSFLRRLLAELGEVRGPEIYASEEASSSSPEGEGEYGAVGLIRQAIEELATEGRVVLVAHAASFALAGQPDLLRAFVTASQATRARRLAEARPLKRKEAEKAIRDSDAARADYLRRFYEIATELPTHYDVIVSTDRLSAQRAAEVVVSAAGGLESLRAQPV
jgi:hypothetical protein